MNNSQVLNIVRFFLPPKTTLKLILKNLSPDTLLKVVSFPGTSSFEHAFESSDLKVLSFYKKYFDKFPWSQDFGSMKIIFYTKLFRLSDFAI